MLRGYRKNGHVDLRRMPVIKDASLDREGAFGFAGQILDATPGEAIHEVTREPTIWLDIGLRGRKRLEILTHEALHLACPWMPELAVTKTARYLAMVLWHYGYRLKEDEE